MNIYQDGKFVETFTKTREHDLLTEFMSKYIATATPEASEPASTEPVVTEPVVSVNPTGEVLTLTSSNFQDVITAGHVFIKFYAPWYVWWRWKSAVADVIQVWPLQEACPHLVAVGSTDEESNDNCRDQL